MSGYRRTLPVPGPDQRLDAPERGGRVFQDARSASGGTRRGCGPSRARGRGRGPRSKTRKASWTAPCLSQARAWATMLAGVHTRSSRMRE